MKFDQVLRNEDSDQGPELGFGRGSAQVTRVTMICKLERRVLSLAKKRASHSLIKMLTNRMKIAGVKKVEVKIYLFLMQSV